LISVARDLIEFPTRTLAYLREGLSIPAAQEKRVLA